jgi:peptidoglycan/LPS O-acetylase OafA/YrhL
VNNFLPIEKQFMGWAWSLAIEEQFYIVFPVALILLLRLAPRYRLPVLVGATLAAGAVFVALLLASTCPVPPPFQELGPEAFLCYFDTLYDKFHTRVGALLVGVIVAYLFNYTSTVRLLDAHAGWRRLLLAIALLLLVPASGFVETSGRGVFSAYFAFNSLYLFALGIGYVVLFTLTEAGKRSIAGRVLSSRALYPLATLSYSAYLVHPTIIIALYTYVVTPTRIAPAAALIAGLAIALVCFGAAAVLYLVVERPAMNARSRFMTGATREGSDLAHAAGTGTP